MAGPTRFVARPIAPGPVYGRGDDWTPEAEELSRALRSVSAPLLQRQARADVARADLAGRASGLAGNLDPIGGGSQQDLAFSGAQRDAYVQQLHGEVRGMTDELAAKYPHDPEAFAQAFDLRAQQISGKVNPEVRELVAGEISMRRSDAISGVRAQFEQNQQVMQGQVREEFQKDLLEDMRRFARGANGDAMIATTAKFEAFWNGEVTAGRMLPEQVDQARADMHAETAFESVYGDFGDALKAGYGVGYLERFKAGPPAELRVEQVDALTRRMESGINRQMRQARQAQRQHEAVIKRNGDEADRLAMEMKAGVDVGDDGNQMFDAMVEGKMPVRPEKLEALVIARDGHDVAAAVTRMPVAQAEAAVGLLHGKPDKSAVNPAEFDTKLTAEEEAAFVQWKAQHAPNDSGQDYDFRGAFKAGLLPGANGHWSDQFKKPNHPTFSDQSQYASIRPDLAGRWEGDTFIEPSNEPRTLREARQRAAADDALRQLREGLTGKDPTGWALQRGVGKPWLPDFSSADNLRASLARAKASTDEMEQTYKQKFSPFTKAQAEHFKQRLESGTPNEQLDMLGAVAQVYRVDSGLVLDQLDKKGARTLAIAGKYVVDGEDGLAREVLGSRMLSAQDRKLAGVGPKDENASTVYESTAGGMFRDERARRIHQDAANALYVQRRVAKGATDGEFSADDYKQAVEDAVGGILEIKTGGGWLSKPLTSKVVAPWRGATDATVNDWIANLQGSDLEALGGTALGAQIGEDEVAKQIREMGQFSVLADGLAVIRNGGLLVDRSGKVFVLKKPGGGGE